jgi:hypothetical protein
LIRAVLSRAEFQAPLAVARNHVSNVWRALFALAGRYRPISPAEKAVALVDTIRFRGDPPRQIKEGVREQGRMAFRMPRPVMESVDNLVVTPMGGGWKDGCFYERYSACRPGLRMLLEAHRPQADYPAGYVIQSAHKDTYGDWVSEYLCAAARAYPFGAPLFLPAWFADRPYVARDLKSKGIEHVFVDKPMRIRQAKVLRQQKYFVHFPRNEIETLRAFLGFEQAEPAPRGIVYLSRKNEVSEVANRVYPNEIIETIVEARGGRIIRTAGAPLEEYGLAASDAETVIFDHGSAIYNSLRWRPIRVVEIVSDAWWNNAFLMFADAMGVTDYTIIRGDLGDEHVARLLNETLDRPVGS